MKKTILEGLAKAGKKMAVKACGAASYFGYHQPIEPAKLKKIAKNK